MSIVQEAIRLATIAVEYDSTKNVQEAIRHYEHAANLLDRASSQMARDAGEPLHRKSQEYRTRAAQLGMEKQDEEDRNLHRCYFLFEQALDADDEGNSPVAAELYTQAVELGIGIKSSDPEKKAQLSVILNKALERAEELKGLSPLESKDNSPTEDDIVSDLKKASIRPVPNRMTATPTVSVRATPKPTLHRGSSAHLKVGPGQAMYTEEEKLVLTKTSQINNNQFVPFMSIDLSENFRFAFTFTDKDGLLTLSSKQKSGFKDWARPEEISAEPKMIVGANVDCFSIKQTIIIDDLLPVNKYNQLLCSYSSNKNEFWVSLLEKAYMKVMGGYDFPGSNSNIDLHALTGWIPERSAIRKDSQDFNSNALFEMIKTNLENGSLLATVATGELSPVDEDRTGLVPTHAYAVLDARIVGGVKLLQLKNPWSHLRWRGNYSELDTVHWTPSLRATLNFDPDTAAGFDNGVFWIDYDSILHFFDVFYLNWNPEIFMHTYCLHQLWNAESGPIKDGYNIGDNPQFSLDVQGNGELWILLTRHITQIDDFRENKEYITVLVYKNDGRRVYYPNDPPPFIDGVRINSPHYLCKLKVGPNSSNRYTLVVSQYEKMRTIYYTLRAYGTCPFKLRKLEPFPIRRQVVGEWTSSLAGGCANNPTYQSNPKYLITLGDCAGANHMVLDLRGPKEYQVGIDVAVVSLEDPSITAPFVTKSSGPYRSGFVILELPDLPSGKYKITVSTYHPNQEGTFILNIKSTADIKISILSPNP